MARRDDPDNPPGRLLFTDFDASRTGRPPGVSFDDSAEPPGAPVRPARSLDDILAQIDLDFEDDVDPQGGEPAPHFRPLPDERDRDAAAFPYLDEEGSRPPPSGVPPPATRLGAGRSDGAFFAGDLAHRLGIDPPGRENGENDLPAPRPDDRSGWGDLDSALEALDGEADILSLLPPAPPSSGGAPAVPIWAEYNPRRRNLGVAPPRLQPYGGIERLDEWYRPPDPADVESSATERVPPRPSPPEMNTGTGRAPPAKGGGTGADRPPADDDTDTAESLFSGIDLGKVWLRREASAADETETGDAEDFFAGIDTAPPPAGGTAGTDARDSTVILDDDALRLRLGNEERGEKELDRPKRRGVTVISHQEYLEEVQKSRPAGKGDDRNRRRREPDGRARSAPREIPAGPSDAAAGNALPPQTAPDEPGPPESGADLAFESEAGSRQPIRRKAATRERSGTGAGDSDGVDPVLDIDSLLGEYDAFLPVAADVEAPVVSDADVVDPRALSRGKGEAGEKADGETAGAAGAEDADERLSVAASGRETGIAGPSPPPEPSPAALPSENDLEALEAIAGEENAEAGFAGGKPEADGGMDGGEGGDGGSAAVDPLDVFNNIDSLGDFGDTGLDEEMQALLDADEAPSGEGGEGGKPAVPAAGTAAVPEGGLDKIRYATGAALLPAAARILPLDFLRRVAAAIAFRENWRFYCDILAALIATASLAVIASYILWYR